MPYYDEEHPGQPLWQSVLLFCFKGMIEGIMVILFFWLLVQVLFTKQLEVNLQILLLVGLIVFCLSLLLGCVLCWRSTRTSSPRDKDRPASAPAPEELGTRPQGPPPASPSSAVAGQYYEELDGDILEYPSTLSSPAPSDNVFAPLTPSPCARDGASSGHKELGESCFSMRRLSMPQAAPPLYRPVDHHSRGSPPCFPGLGLLSKTRRFLERRCTVTGDQISYSERLQLTSAAQEPIPLAPLYYGSGYDAGSSPWVRFTAAFSPEHRALTVTVAGISGTAYRLEDVWAEGGLAMPGPKEASGPGGQVSRAAHQSLVLVLSVGSVEELRCCVLRLSLHTRHPPWARSSLLGELEVQCEDKDWRADHPIHFTKELSTKKCALKMSDNFLEAPLRQPGLSCSPQILAQLFILLQYQTLAHRIKAMVLRADQLDSLSHLPTAPGYQVVANLHHEGTVIATKRTAGGNTAFLFDLPPGDLRHMHVTLELIVMQNQSVALGRVLIGPEAPGETERAHWREMCSRGQVERAQWHAVHPEPL
ncbi:hypothetical protein NHX12_002874 [Muraenolepis orangiensis]|uniref:Uncharacterized protein n=1 Tax=Muraenolepis orangiensis TaxID=630683 RepID=A0A9Q0DXG1_9TELE|nr:hypothetical protein NHX12_002874 [Muraenolepis orangiensis]